MRLGMLARCDAADLDLVQRLGFRCLEWVRFEESPCGSRNADWKSAADAVGEDVQRRGLRISAIAAWYRNALDPKQTDEARRVMDRAIEVARRLKIRTIGAFPGAAIETSFNERGGNLVYGPAENSISAAIEFWRPIAHRAKDAGVRIAFEHCPQGAYHLPVMHWNVLGQPALWTKFFQLAGCDNLGIEWDAAHLICQMIDPLQNIREFGSRIFHVHAKDAIINEPLMRRYGICHPGVAEHRFPGLGQSDWGQIISELLRAGYDSDLNIEGWHDPIYRDHLEETGLRIAKQTLEPLIAGTDA
jgi:sugar phosphate isomerase/epimerase